MVRAGIFIGVDKTGDLDKLQDAASGAKRMFEWAVKQGLPPETHARLITDADGSKIGPDQIYDAIEKIINDLHVKGPGLDQLIVYFAGHGVNINRSEHWLLSDAPVKPSAAVNVSGSVELARYCGIRHVVFISDACRVAPVGIQVQNVRGVDVFPNLGDGYRAKPVDQFYACLLGNTAAEIKDQKNCCSRISSALHQCNAGSVERDLSRGRGNGPNDPTDTAVYVMSRKLEKCLETRVPEVVPIKKVDYNEGEPGARSYHNI